MKFIVKESNCFDIVNSKEFESLDKFLMVEIIRRKFILFLYVRLVVEIYNEVVISTFYIKNLLVCICIFYCNNLLIYENFIIRYWSIKVVIVMKKKEVKKFM